MRVPVRGEAPAPAGHGPASPLPPMRDPTPPGPAAPTDACVRLDAPIVPQVRALGAGYDAWVHRSIRPKGSLRMFESDLLEAFSHVPWWLVLVVWVPVVLALGLLSVLWQGLSPGLALAWAAGGLLLWTLLEYVLHRWLFHWVPAGATGRQLHFLMHGIHHLDPWDGTRLVFPPLAGVIVALPIFGLLWLALPLAAAMAAMAGLLVGYIAYDMTHYHVHHRACRTRWGKFLKAWHLAHHHKHWDAMFGVSTPLWDLVFRTGRPVGPARAEGGPPGAAGTP